MFPVEYVYGDWFWWQESSNSKHSDPECPTSSLPTELEAGSRVEGFCIPQFFLAKSDVDPLNEPLLEKEHWRPDLDVMTEIEPFAESEKETIIPIFTVEHAADDARYAKLRLTNEWKEDRPGYKNTSFLHHTCLLPSGDHPFVEGNKVGESEKWSHDIHGPVRKLYKKGSPSYEEDHVCVFKYPIAWPEPAMEWLIRPRVSGWPSPALVQEILESSCHLAPVGRGKRFREPIELLEYTKTPESAASSRATEDEHCEEKMSMDETEWRTSFSLAENKLGQSMSPVQRHVIVLLKMIKKLYFPEVISSYYLKNLLFWECENREESFWREENSGKCLLSMLDCLQKCLEEGHLQHYIMPQSNLLQSEDPVRLAEAAAIVADVRRNILPKTISLLRRLQSLDYMSSTFLEDLELEPYLSKIQDSSLAGEEMRELLGSLQLVFTGKYKDVIAALLRMQAEPDEEADVHLPICLGSQWSFCLYAYQSLLARNLCKLWFLKSDENNSKQTNEEEVTSFVREEIVDHSLGEEFITLSLQFFGQMKEGKDPSLVVPHTSVMEHMKEMQKRQAYECVEEEKPTMKELFELLHTSDFKELEKKVVEEVKERFDISWEDIETVLDNALEVLHPERLASALQETTDSGAGPSTE